MPPLFASFWHYVFGVLMFLTAMFLILLIMVQRGRGGGLAGAFGGLGGQSAFGAKAGDLFTRITMIVATIWIVLCMAAIKVLNSQSSKFGAQPGRPTLNAPPLESAADQSEQAPSGSPGAGGPAAPGATDRNTDKGAPASHRGASP